MSQRFTIDGDEALERHLSRTCDLVKEGVTRVIPAGKVAGLLLGGGYGRGEGGVLRGNDGDKPYNDLEFYVFVRGNRLLAEKQYGPGLHALGESLSPAAGLEVEFKIVTAGQVRNSPTLMFYYDLVMGHRWLLGEETLLEGCEHHRDETKIPLYEATRLLMNRCSGLLFALTRLEKSAISLEDGDFAHRNQAKLKLALGDVLLAAHGKYHWSCRERNQRLGKLSSREWSDLVTAAEFDEIRDLHRDGTTFKLHPVRVPPDTEALLTTQRHLTRVAQSLWLGLESKRLGVGFASMDDYIHSPINKCSEVPAWRCLLLNLRNFGARGILDSRRFRYPRERVLNALAFLLFRVTDASVSADWTFCGQELQSHPSNLSDALQAYRRLWGRFN